jgi:hypothetical protein
VAVTGKILYSPAKPFFENSVFLLTLNYKVLFDDMIGGPATSSARAGKAFRPFTALAKCWKGWVVPWDEAQLKRRQA